jgi:hypothetical protein
MSGAPMKPLRKKRTCSEIARFLAVNPVQEQANAN